MARAAMAELNEKDGAAAIAFLVAQEDRQLAVKVCGALMHHFYWQKKDLHLSLLFGRTGIQHALTSAASTDGQTALELRGSAKALLYDIASFTWSGWDEQGIVIGLQEAAAGLDAARANLRLAQELEKGDLPASRAWWMLGAQLLTAGEYAEAQTAFERAAPLAAAADKPDEELLSQAFGQLSFLQTATDPIPVEQQLNELLTELGALEEGEFFVGQVTTARKVLERE